MSFQLANLAQRLQFQDETFDIVHARMVMMHVADGPNALLRVSRLVKPGGLLLIEDLDGISAAESGGPATRQVVYKLKEIQERRGVDIGFGRKIEALITSLGNFSDIQAKKISMPYGANASDEALNQLGLGMKKSFTEFFYSLLNSLHDQGLTHELVPAGDLKRGKVSQYSHPSTFDNFMDDGIAYAGFPAAFDNERLDAQHNTITRYFGGKLGPAPINDLRPSKIIELGCGNGAWAIQAATQFPDAQVVAVDQYPLPDRLLPPNLRFHRADLAQGLEFEDAMFDIVHSRMVMAHVSPLIHTSSLELTVVYETKMVDGPDIVRRASRLVKPGGLLLIEKTDMATVAESAGPAGHRIVRKFIEIEDRLGADAEFGKKVEDIITSLGDFSDIHTEKVSIPFAANTSDEALNQFGLGMKKSFTEFFGALPHRLQDLGLTHELFHEFRE
ncbi:S-adenosyl-L-methionine-dependent methyltransferase [Mycena sanguinolenta]|uniref:S-adenosyl-L-methionine-dependent methyltransferase n=1 Tax=Mycena sanguinolenta TaxID=230812 RepID=A0A8H7DKM1_9AGAR|nr:S-adenosyl-L-methionine-dependent methyltransferase [Mycena sanguinolenta]